MSTSINQPPIFVTSTELDPFTSTALNMRFAGFLIVLADRYQLNIRDLMSDAKQILADADVPQDTLITSKELDGPCDLTPFEI